MRYIRFLKPPTIKDRTISTLITITSDLGETLLEEEIKLRVFLDSGDISKLGTVTWLAHSRVLQISFPLSTKRRQNLFLSVSTSRDGSDALADLPLVLSATSPVIDGPIDD